MKTDWRKVRDNLTEEQAFSTSDTFNHTECEQEICADDGRKGMVKSVNSVESPKRAFSPPNNPKVNSAKSAKSPSPDVLDSWEWIAERAAILQFDAGLDREQAEVQAFMCWYHHFVEAE